MKRKQLEAVILVALVGIVIIVSSGCNSVQNRYTAVVKEEFSKQPLDIEKILTQSDLDGLPTPVQKYIIYSGAVGKSIPQNFRLEFDAKMTKKSGNETMDASSEQINFFGNYSRIFFMKASAFLVPFRILHVYRDQKATFVVRVASLFDAVDLSGELLTSAETVTILNDMCVFAPGALIDKRLSWKSIDSLSSEVAFTNGPYSVSAILYFNGTGELINFISNDRYALQDDGSLKKYPWLTPIGTYKNFNGRMVSTTGTTIYRYPEGDFTYGTFILKSIVYNVRE